MALEGSYGPKMSALTDRQRRFVEALFNQGTRNATKAAEAAGYSDSSYGSLKVQGHRLLHDARIQEAIHEHAVKALNGEVPASVATLIEIRDDPTATPNERRMATLAILDRAGMHGVSEHKTTVEHLGDDKNQLARIAAMALQLGIDPTQLVGRRLAKQLPPVVIENEQPAFVFNPDDY